MVRGRNGEKWQQLNQELKGSAEYKEHREESERLSRLLGRYVHRSGASEFIAGSPDTPHGYVWLFRQK